MHGKIGVQIQVTTCLRCAWWYDSNVWKGKLERGRGGGVAVRAGCLLDSWLD